MFNLDSIYLAAIIQSLFLICLLVFNRRENRQANIFLACLIGLLSISLWNTYVWYAGLDSYWKLFNYNIWVTAFLWGPALYLYVGIIAGRGIPNKLQVLRHCTFALILFVIQGPVYLATQYNWIAPDHITAIHRIIVLALYIHLFLYFYASLQILRIYSIKIKENYSTIEKVNLNWLKRLIYIFALLISVDMATTVPAFILQEEMPYIYMLMLAESATIYLIGYFSLSQGEVLFQNSGGSEKESAKYSNSPLDYSLSNELVIRLNTIMLDSKIYQKNDLRLSVLAEKVGVSPHHLSQLINEHCQNNFYDYVNKYRVDFAAEALSKSRHSNITEIAFESGFNNRASFNSSFKKHLGMTPSKYRQQQHASVELNPL